MGCGFFFFQFFFFFFFSFPPLPPFFFKPGFGIPKRTPESTHYVGFPFFMPMVLFRACNSGAQYHFFLLVGPPRVFPASVSPLKPPLPVVPLPFFPSTIAHPKRFRFNRCLFEFAPFPQGPPFFLCLFFDPFHTVRSPTFERRGQTLFYSFPQISVPRISNSLPGGLPHTLSLQGLLIANTVGLFPKTSRKPTDLSFFYSLRYLGKTLALFPTHLFILVH